ncbi:ubiquitin thioesterase OTU1-like isoform X1 [Hibiscus syriacus]|uniref:Ubiquitin thioesterase OTU1-like isoform X1 n=1 Tax=Hibiscus syriacus TaxID=106335 RepID=A0A6A3CW55_HIBSY|nr:ubiquitin thioesterase OTU1-like isoform X1 [Hibiscus syriacus]
MAWCSLRSIHVPTIDVGCLRTHSPLAAAGSSVWRYSSRNGSPFACLSLSTSPGIKEAVATDKAPAALGPYCQAIKANNILCLWLADLKDFKKVNEIYAKYFPSPAPARSTYQVAALPLDAKIEIECIAALKA